MKCVENILGQTKRITVNFRQFFGAGRKKAILIGGLHFYAGYGATMCPIIVQISEKIRN